MNGRIFLDTNVLVYSYDRSEPLKQGRATAVLGEIASLDIGAISTQILGELFISVTRKIKAPLSIEEGTKRVEQHLQIWRTLDISSLIVLEALRGVRRHHLHFWDAQIWATARMNQVQIVFSEDFSDGSSLEGVRFVNPFSPEFHLSDWV